MTIKKKIDGWRRSFCRFTARVVLRLIAWTIVERLEAAVQRGPSLVREANRRPKRRIGSPIELSFNSAYLRFFDAQSGTRIVNS